MGRKYKFNESPLPGESLLCYYLTLGGEVVFERWLEGEDMGLDVDGNPILYSEFGVEYVAKGWHPPLLLKTRTRTHHFGGDELERQKAEFAFRVERQKRIAAYAAAIEKGEEITFPIDEGRVGECYDKFPYAMMDYMSHPDKQMDFQEFLRNLELSK